LLVSVRTVSKMLVSIVVLALAFNLAAAQYSMPINTSPAYSAYYAPATSAYVMTPYGPIGSPYGPNGGYPYGGGYNIRTTPKPKENCNVEFRIRDDETEYAQSPSWPSKYPNNRDCTYKFESRSGKPLKLVFKKFDIEYNKWCNWDWVKIFDGEVKRSNKMDKLCGSEEDGEFVTKGSLLNIVFHSDSSVTKGGFDAKITVVADKGSTKDDQKTKKTIQEIEQEINDAPERIEDDDQFFESFLDV